jgi:Phage integrase, N-terminal SAM-like domain
MSRPTILLPFQPATMSGAQLAAVSFLARYSGRTHSLYAYQLREWFAWCESNGVDPLVGVQRAHVELYIRGLGDRGLMDSSVNTMMHAVRGYFRFAHIDGLIGSDPAVYARLPKVHGDESRTQGLDRLELIRFLQTRGKSSISGVSPKLQTSANNRSWQAKWSPAPGSSQTGTVCCCAVIPLACSMMTGDSSACRSCSLSCFCRCSLEALTT